jgi:protein-disulfide isomerase
MEPYTSESKTSVAVPIAIVAGFAMIAIAIFFTGNRVAAPTNPIPVTSDGTEFIQGTPRPVDETDYIRGNPNAPILMIEYSDYDCPFCKQYHSSMKQIMDEYGVTGRLAWVYRQFPLVQLHPNAPLLSEAALCVGDIGGNDAFWNFSDLIFEERAIDEFTNVTLLPEYAEEVGVSRSEFQSCLDSGRMEAAVTASLEDGFNVGARGTPYTILIVGNQQAVINGAQSYDTIKSIVDNLIQQLDGTFTATTTAQ